MTRLSRSWRPWCLAWLAPLLAAPLVPAESPPSPKVAGDPASRQELWVPTRHLEEVLKQHPNAVMLDAKQYEALIRDAGKVKPLHEAKAPVDTAVEDARVEVMVSAEGSYASVDYLFSLANLKDQWCEVLLPLPVTEEGSQPWGMRLVNLHTEKPVLLKPEGEGLRVLTQGLGRYKLRLSYIMEPGWQTGTGTIYPLAPQPSAKATVVTLGLPEGWQPVNPVGEAVKEGTRAALNLSRAAIPMGDTPDVKARSRQHFAVAWQRASGTRQDGRASHVYAEMAYRLAPDKITGITLLTYPVLPDLENDKLVVQVPQGVQVLSVKSDAAVLNWKVEGERLEIEGVGKAGSLRSLAISFEQPLLLPPKGAVPVVLPVFKDGKGSFFARWNCFLLASPGVDVRFDELSRASVPAPKGLADGGWAAVLSGSGDLPGPGPRSMAEVKGDIRLHKEFLGAMMFDAPPDKVEVRVSRAADRFSVDVDTLAAVSAHETALTRTLLFHGEAGTTERATVTLPAGETFLGASLQCETGMEWKQVGQALEVAWPKGLNAGVNATLVVRSRKEIGSGAAEGSAKETLVVTGPQVSESARTSGYVALQFDESWKVNVTNTTGLEARDVVLSPVKGRMAWYCLKDWQLQFELTRREPVHDVALTAYALPRARQVEIEGQVGLQVSGAPLRKFDVKLDPKLAPLFRVTSPLVAEQVLDEASGVWHFTLRKEVLGTGNIRFRMNLPAADGGGQTLRSTLPDIATPGARRRTTSWVVEANTDTEIEFATKGVQPTDSLRPPVVEGYQPRHRVIAAYSAGSGEHEIQLTARRHNPASLAGAVVLEAKLVSVISQDGPARHEASYTLRHNGRQFLSLALPKGAVLLSTLVQDRPVKPVQAAGAHELRLPLPVLQSEADYVSARVVYETPAMTWGSWGKAALEPPVLLEGVPVLSTGWKVHAPEGFALRHTGGGLEPGGAGPEACRGLLAMLWELNPFATGRGWVGAASTESQVDFLPGLGTSSGDWWIESLRPEKVAAIRDFTWKMEQLVLPELKLQGVNVAEAFATLDRLARERDALQQDPAKRGVRMFVEPGTVHNNSSVISLDLRDVPFIEALRYVTELAGCKYRVEPDRVVVIPLSDLGTERYTRRFKFPMRNFLAWQDAGTYGEARKGAPSIPKGLIPIVDELKAQGIPFPEDTNAAYDADAQEVVVRNTQPNLDQVEAFVEGKTKRSLEEADANDLDLMVEALEKQVDAPPDHYYRQKMNAIILPEVKFENATIEEAVEFLRLKSIELDLKERDSSRRGVNLVFKPGGMEPTARINLDLKEVPMSEALRYVCELAGMKFRVEPFAVLVMPLSDVGTDQYTRTFKVPPNFISSAEADGKEQADPFASGDAPGHLKRRSTARDILSSSGISFPEGSSAVYVAATSQLIVRDTQANLDRVEAWVNKLNVEALKELRARLGKSSKAGLIPVDLEIPVTGQLMEFAGQQKAGRLLVHYVSWEWQLFRTSLLVVLGALGFRLLGRDRPWMSTLLVALLLTFVPPLLFPAWLPSCNALLLGWLLALALRLLWKLLLWCTPLPNSRSAAGKEAVV